MKTLIIALAAPALAFSGAALADDAGGGRAMPQGDVTRAEAQQRAGQMFDRMDVNKDGVLNEADRTARQAAMFDEIDADHNGTVTRAEFEAHQAAMQERRGDRMARKGDRRQGMRQGMMGKTNGPVTRQAFVDRALGMFDRADANKDGVVTPAERQAMRATMRQQWQARPAAGQQG